MLIKKDSIVLFQGDSITHWGRDPGTGQELGTGYVMMAASWLNATFPELNLKFFNRGICGNRIVDLKARWKEDCLDLKPDVVTILVGINDTWRRYKSNLVESADEYAEAYRDILTQVKENLNASIILCEPFLIPVCEELKMWREDLDPKIHVVRELAREFNAVYIPFDGLFAQAAVKREPAFWSDDGIHPYEVGHALMAKKWLKAVGAGTEVQVL